MKPPIIIQARTGSKRLPRKVLAELAGRTVLEYVIRRCQQSTNSSEVIVATSTLPGDNGVTDLAALLGIPVYRGNENDVLLRYIEAARRFDATVLIRITADCPLIDPVIIDRVVDIYRQTPTDYVLIQGYPNGVGAAELLTLPALERSLAETRPDETYYREHVMTYIVDHPEKFSLHIEDAPTEFWKPEIHLSVDEPDDLAIVRRICEYFAPRLDFHTGEIIEFLADHPDLELLSKRRQKE